MQVTCDIDLCPSLQSNSPVNRLDPPLMAGFFKPTSAPKKFKPNFARSKIAISSLFSGQWTRAHRKKGSIRVSTNCTFLKLLWSFPSICYAWTNCLDTWILDFGCFWKWTRRCSTNFTTLHTPGKSINHFLILSWNFLSAQLIPKNVQSAKPQKRFNEDRSIPKRDQLFS